MNKTYKENILSYVRSLGIPVSGIAGDGITYSQIVCLFPYYTGRKNEGNISMYAYACDYHEIVSCYLLKIALHIQSLSPSSETKIHVDKGEGDDKKAALAAGLGFIGKNTLLINEEYGSFVFIGYVETDLILEPDVSLESTCLSCGLCEKHCPSGAIKNGKINPSLCASSISQKKGILSSAEEEILVKSGLIWGCDICQTVCPHNQTPLISPLTEFHSDLLFSLSPLHMSNKEFFSAYGNRAFSWRGKAILNRNMEIHSMHEKKNDGHTN